MSEEAINQGKDVSCAVKNNCSMDMEIEYPMSIGFRRPCDICLDVTSNIAGLLCGHYICHSCWGVIMSSPSCDGSLACPMPQCTSTNVQPTVLESNKLDPSHYHRRMEEKQVCSRRATVWKAPRKMLSEKIVRVPKETEKSNGHLDLTGSGSETELEIRNTENSS